MSADLVQKGTPMSAVLTPVRPSVRTNRPSLPTLVRIEVRKSLATRSGKALAVAAVVLPPSAMAVASAGGEAIGGATGPIAAMGIFAALLLLALGVLSTAGEWTHGSVQTTFLLVPHRGRVLTAKAVAVALLGALLAALSTAAASALPDRVDRDLRSSTPTSVGRVAAVARTTGRAAGVRTSFMVMVSKLFMTQW